MNGDWINREIDAIEKADRQRDHREQLQLHRAKVLANKGPAFFGFALAAVNDAVKRLNQRFSGDPNRRLEFQSEHNGTMPVIGAGGAIAATLTADGSLVQFDGRGGLSASAPPPVQFQVDERDNVSAAGLGDGTFFGLAHHMLRPFLDVYKSR